MPASDGMLLPSAGSAQLGFALYNNVVNIDFHSSTDQGLEDFPH